MTRPPLALSHTGMRALNCPCHYFAKYLDPAYKERQSMPALKGQLGHKVAEDYIAHLARHNRRRDYDYYAKVILATVEPYAEDIRQAVQDVGEIFVGVWELNRHALSHQPELILAVDRETLAPTDNFEVAGQYLRAIDRDILTGRVDYRALFKAGKKSEIWDFKMGEEHVSPDSAKDNPQLLHYAALDFLSDPRREEVEVILWGVKYGRGNLSRYSYSREQAIDPARERWESAFTRLDMLYDLPAGTAWPPIADVHDTCRWCPVPEKCPKNIALLPEILDTFVGKKPRRRKSA